MSDAKGKTAMKKDFLPNHHESAMWKENKLVCGIDEVGRGCLAGPLTVAAAILPKNTTFALSDSKKLSASARQKAFAWLTTHAWYAVAYADHTTITSKNIYQATLHAMRKACLCLMSRYPHLWHTVGAITVDAMPLTLPAQVDHCPPIHHFNKGEDFSSSIAAASIIAKVTRDTLMHKISPLFPSYTFSSDKAYASKKHCDTLCVKPATFIHRPQFIATVRRNRQKHHEQQSHIF